ncbi:MAG: helix-turn-helix transcriptional regulator [Atopobiaceae bacterium]|nr:helix-turn-helix transcriptional regulator [Atopobiaceae bacterium]
MDSIKERVGAYLEREGKTKKWLADELDMSTVTLNSKLNGETEFSFSQAIRLSDVLGCTVSELRISPFAN